MNDPDKPEANPQDLASHYRPLGIRALSAVGAIKGRVENPQPRLEPTTYGRLPEGFHMPDSVQDD